MDCPLVVRQHAHLGHGGKNPPCQAVTILLGQPHAHAHFHHQARSADAVQAPGQGAFQHGSRTVHPDKIHIHVAGHRHQLVCRQLIDAYLGQLPQKNIAGMDIHCQVSPLDIVHDFLCHILMHGAALAARENPVHIQVKARQAAINSAYAHRIKGWINLHAPQELPLFFRQNTAQLPRYILPLQLIAVGAGNHANPLA